MFLHYATSTGVCIQAAAAAAAELITASFCLFEIRDLSGRSCGVDRYICRISSLAASSLINASGLSLSAHYSLRPN